MDRAAKRHLEKIGNSTGILLRKVIDRSRLMSA